MDIISRFDNVVIFSAEAETTKDLLMAAILANADLRGANLRGANLRDANLRGANLRGANLRDANLSGTDLRGANLCGADLRGADLRDADLYEANLRGADLRDADLYEADLRGADLRRANLRGANAQINGHAVIQVNGLPYPILITDTHLRAGCQNHTFAEWRDMTPEQIQEMDGQDATDFYPTLLSLIDLLCRDREAAQQETPK